jgi:hypothetical protein
MAGTPAFLLLDDNLWHLRDGRAASLHLCSLRLVAHKDSRMRRSINFTDDKRHSSGWLVCAAVRSRLQEFVLAKTLHDVGDELDRRDRWRRLVLIMPNSPNS